MTRIAHDSRDSPYHEVDERVENFLAEPENRVEPIEFCEQRKARADEDEGNENRNRCVENLFWDSSQRNSNDKRREHGRNAQANVHVGKIVHAETGEEESFDTCPAQCRAERGAEHDADEEGCHAGFVGFEGEEVGHRDEG